MNYFIVYPDELNHYGVRGMKWGVRKDPVSMGGRARRALAGVFSINERAYKKLGNNTLASMNAAAKKQQLRKANESDKAKRLKVQAKREKKLGETAAKEQLKTSKQLQKVDKYRNKLAAKAALSAARNERYAKNTKRNLQDLKTNGTSSSVFKNSQARANIKNESSQRTKKILDSNSSLKTKALLTGLDYMAYSKKTNRAYKDMVENHKSEYKSAKQRAKTWETRNSKLMSLDVSNLSKKDVKKVYKGKQ